MNKKNIQLEKSEILSETQRRNYERIRITRLKYKENPNQFIDIRLFQRGDEDENGNEIFYPTKKGVQFKESDFQSLLGKWTLMPKLILHPIIINKSWKSVITEQFDNAVFNAYKSIEIRIRKLSNLNAEDIGVALVRKAFNPKNGPLAEKSLPISEKEAISHLFSGAIGLYKNPQGHRDVEIDFKECFIALLMASNLHSILDNIEKRICGATSDNTA
jgi:uncharacterized protein (TIGR02391 family)